ncbi:MAG: sugar ABC transporter substrate-binding protein [Elusimicrobiota bacterium]
MSKGKLLLVGLLMSFLSAKALLAEEITIWAMGAEGMKIAAVARKFEKENPGIRVKTQAIPWEAAHEKLVIAVVGGIPPDLAQLGTTWMAEFKAMDALSQLDDLAKQSKIIQADKFFSGSWNTCLIKDKLYGVPWYVDTRVLFYRKDILKKAGYEKPPATWEEFKELCQALVKDRGKEKKFSIALPIKDWGSVSLFIWQNGGELLAPLDPKFKEAVVYYKSFFDEKLAPTKESADVDLYHAFSTGYYPMFISGPWTIEQLRKGLPELNDKWDVAMLPKKLAPTSFVGGCNLVVFKGSKHKAAAWKFIEYLSRPEAQVEWYKNTTDLPSLKLAWKDPYIQSQPNIKVFEEQMKFTKSPPALPEWEQIADALQNRMEQMILNKKTIDAGLKAFDEDLREIIPEYFKNEKK